MPPLLTPASERYSSHVPHADHAAAAAAAASLMAIPNSSYHSLGGRPMSRAVDVTDLRDALGGGGGTAAGNASAAVSVVSSTTHSRASLASPEKKVKPDAKEILKEIFKDKKK